MTFPSDWSRHHPVDMEEEYSLGGAERRSILRALKASRWNKSRAARLLGVSKTTLYRKMGVYGISQEEIMLPRENRYPGSPAGFGGAYASTPPSMCVPYDADFSRS